MEDVNSKYTILDKIAYGSYGIVYNALHKKSNTAVVIKHVYNCLLSKYEMFLIYKELAILAAFKNTHANIISIKDAFIHENSICLVFDKMNTNLQLLLNQDHLITNNHIQHLLYILLKTIDFLHEHNIIHRDIKPTNILVSYPFEFKLCDFGMSYYINTLKESSTQLEKHVATRWYRAPEVCLQGEYNTQMDIWSIGCIFAELLSILRNNVTNIFKTPTILFPGKCNFPLSPDPSEKITDGDQLIHIMKICGIITETDIQNMNIQTAGKHILEQIIPIMKYYKQIPLEEVFINVQPEALDLLKKMLIIDPTKRITAKDALSHCYFNEIKTDDYKYKLCEPNHDFLYKINEVEDYSSDILYKELILLIGTIHSSE